MTDPDLLLALNALLAVATDPDEFSAVRVEAAEEWLNVIASARAPGAHHADRLPDSEIQAHREAHEGRVGSVLLRKFHGPQPIPADEKFPTWACRAPSPT